MYFRGEGSPLSWAADIENAFSLKLHINMFQNISIIVECWILFEDGIETLACGCVIKWNGKCHELGVCIRKFVMILVLLLQLF